MIPAAVAVMVKLNDIVAGNLRRDEALAACVGRPPAWSRPVTAPARITTEIDGDDAVLDPAGGPDPPASANGSGTGARYGVWLRYRPCPIRPSAAPAGADNRARGNQGQFNPCSATVGAHQVKREHKHGRTVNGRTESSLKLLRSALGPAPGTWTDQGSSPVQTVRLSRDAPLSRR